jgi:hypothetical protein
VGGVGANWACRWGKRRWKKAKANPIKPVKPIQPNPTESNRIKPNQTKSNQIKPAEVETCPEIGHAGGGRGAGIQSGQTASNLVKLGPTQSKPEYVRPGPPPYGGGYESKPVKRNRVGARRSQNKLKAARFTGCLAPPSQRIRLRRSRDGFGLRQGGGGQAKKNLALAGGLDNIHA